MDTPIITIGREYGAGGHTVARIIAQRLGIPAYDKEIIKLTAEESGLNEAVLQSTEESDGLRKLISWFLPSGAVSTYDQAILAQAQVIRNIAAQGPCVIVGRGADYILRDLPNVVNVFLYANREDKLRYAMDTYGDSPEQAARRRRPGVLLPLPHQEKVGGSEELPPQPEHQPRGQGSLRGAHPPVRPAGGGGGAEGLALTKSTATAPVQALWLSFPLKKEGEQKKPGESVDFPPGKW